ncbi:endo-1,4-beta-xylanase [Methylobacterium gossipiicola]|uniref:Beta-xylanase n=1 Tax=Methylobacterium gossipiicola TaxID=582675 RepID=A0A1I2U129_9HYPH|nr:endo-1,4-beta-xylanase [Methylobacterium gossipiicola]SFG70149.1 endo-1,4-beta-xylanase [Methylobacterium gossipiicola]
MRLTRRAILGGALALATGPASAEQGSSAVGGSWAADSLNAAAAKKGIAYGSAVNITPLRQNPAYGEVLARECGVLVPENAMKLAYAWRAPGPIDFSFADETAAFARANGQRLRGHTLVWHEGVPAWALPRIERDAEGFLREWIGAMAGRYRGRIEAWDVVNEICGPDSGRADGLKATPWLAALGPRFVDLAFALQHEADPAAAGAWNENDLELDADWIAPRRAMVLRTLEGMVRRGVPIRRLGLQGHLYAKHPLNQGSLRRFLKAVADLGLALEVTELDVNDRDFPADLTARDRAVSDLARRFLDVVLDEPATLNVLTWDITNANTWLNTNPQRRRADGLIQRALPLDETMARTPLWTAMHKAFSDAPDHKATRDRLRRG